LQACVQCQQFQSGPLMDQTDEYGDPACNSCEFKVKAVEKAEVITNSD
jgi:hypothetical protein